MPPFRTPRGDEVATVISRRPAHGRLRVLYSFPHEIGAPGIGTTALNQVLALHGLGCDVTVWCASSRAPFPDGVGVFETMRWARLRVPHRAIGVERAYAYHDRMVASELRRQPRGTYDVVHTWPLGGLTTMQVAACVGTASLRETPNTYTRSATAEVAHELQVLGLTAPRRHSHAAPERRLRLEDEEFDAADGLLVPSDHVADSFVAARIPPEKLFRHRYGYDPARFKPVSKPVSSPLTAVFAGSCEPRKGLHYALDAWYASGASASGAQLLICGRFEREYRRLLAPRLDDPSIRVMDFCDRLDKTLADADILVLPSVEEGSALVTYEAMGSGAVPVVSSACGAPVIHDVDGLVHPARDVNALTGHLAALMEDQERLVSLRAGALSSASRLTWRESGRSLIDAYRRCMAVNAA